MKKIAYFVITFSFLVYLYEFVDWRSSLDIIFQANLWILLLTVLIGILNSYLIAVRFKIIFSINKNLSTNYFFLLGYFGSFISLVAPFSLGGISISFLLSEKSKISYLKSFLFTFTDYFIGFIPGIFMAFWAIVYFYLNNLITINIKLFLVILIFTIFSLVIYYLKKEFIFKSYIFIRKNLKIFWKSIFVSFIVFLLGNLQMYLFFNALNIHINFSIFIMANSLLGLLSLIPGAPGKIGQYETFGVLTLPFLIGVENHLVFSALVLSRIVSSLTIIVLGYISILFLNINIWNIFKYNPRNVEKDEDSSQ